MRRLIRYLLGALAVVLLASSARGNQAAQGWCESGAQVVVTSGLTSTTQVQASYPSCTVTVYVHGGGLATIYSDNSGTPQANPFTAGATGQWLFYGAAGRYDINLSGAGFPSTVTYSDVLLSDSQVTNVALLPNTTLPFSATPAFNGALNVAYTMSLTGNVTSSTITGTPANGNLMAFTLCQTGAGGFTMAWPVNFVIPTTFVFNTSAAPACNYLSFKFDGVNWTFLDNPGGASGGTVFYQTVQVAGSNQPQEQKLNFPSGVTCADNPGSQSTDCTPNSAYQLIQNNASSLPAEPKWNAVPPFTCADNAGNTRTDCNVPIAVGVGGSHASGLVPDPGASGSGADYLGRDMGYHTSAAAGTVKPDPATSIQYATGTCNGGSPCSDANDGLSWGTAKLTVMAALNALPNSNGALGVGSGTVYVGPGAVSNPAGSQYGIWIMDPRDPNYSAPPTGWYKCIDPGNHLDCQYNIVGVPNIAGGPNGHTNRVTLTGGSNADRNHPGLWLTAGNGVTIQNLAFGGGRAGVLGECSDNSRGNTCGVVGATFINDQWGASQTATNGPALDITGYSYWLWFRDCGWSGNAINATGGRFVDRAAGILMDGRGNNGQGLIYVTDANFAAGGIKNYAGSLNVGGLYVTNAIEEGDFTHDIPPLVWFVNGISDSYLFSLNVADAGPSGTYTVENDGGGPATGGQTGPTVFNIIGPTLGPMVSINANTTSVVTSTVSPLANQQAGFFNGFMMGQTDIARRIAGLVPQRFSNNATNDSTQWTPSNAGTTITAGKTDPYGGTRAATVVNNSGSNSLRFSTPCIAWPGGGTVAVGTWAIGGIWVQGMSATAASLVPGCNGSPDPSGTTYGTWGMQNGTSTDWVFRWFATKIVTPNASTGTALEIIYNTTPVTVYGPVFYLIPTGTMSDNEVLAFANSMASTDAACPAGSVCNVTGHPLSVDTLVLRNSGFKGSLVAPTLTGSIAWTPAPFTGTVPVLTGAVTGTKCLHTVGTTGQVQEAANDCGSGGGAGTINSMQQFSVPYASDPGSSTTLSGSLAPTTPAVFQAFGVLPSGGNAAKPVFALPGVAQRTNSLVNDTIVDTDRVTTVVESNAAPNNAVTIADPGTTGFTQSYAVRMKMLGAGNITTLTPTTATCNGSAFCQFLQGQDLLLRNDGTSWFADVHDPPLIAGSNVTLTRGDYGLTISTVGGASVPWQNQGSTIGTPSSFINCSTNMTCSFSGGVVTLVSSATPSTAFSALTTATNIQAAMLVGTGASLGTTGTGTITATSVPYAGITGFVFPGAGIANSTGSAWGTSYGTTGTGTTVALQNNAFIGLANATGLPMSTGVTGTMQAAQEPAHTGDATNTAGSLAMTVSALRNIALPTLAASTGFLYDTAGVLSLSTSASNLTAGTLPHAQLPALVSGDIPNNAANTTGNANTATNLSTTGANSTFWGVSGGVQGYFTPAGTISGLTTGVVPTAASSTSIGNSSPQLDIGVSAANTLTFAGTGGEVVNGPVTSNGDGVHAGLMGLVGNTANPTIPANRFGILGFNSTSATAYFLQFSTTAPAGSNTFPSCAAPVSNVSQCTWAAAPGGVTAISGDGGLISNSSSTGAVTLTLTTAGAHKYWGNNTGSTAAPGYFSLVAADIPTLIPIANIGTAGLTGTPPVAISAAGAITCVTCVVATSPGAGIAHFAGSTQTVTSSAVALTDLATQAADTVLINATASSQPPTAYAFPSTGTNGCAGTTDALIYNNSSHAFLCHQISALANPMNAAGQMIYGGTGGSPTAVTAASAAKKVLVSGTSGTGAPNFIDFPDVKIIPAANCTSTTAGGGWTTNATLVAACGAALTTAHTNNLNGVLQGTPSVGTAVGYFDFELPGDWDTSANPYIAIYYGSGENTTGTVIWTISTACTKQDGSVTDDPSWIAESAMGTQTMANKNRMWAQSAQLAGAMTNCIAGSTMFVKVALSGTASSSVNVSKATITVPRLLTVQAN